MAEWESQKVSAPQRPYSGCLVWSTRKPPSSTAYLAGSRRSYEQALCEFTDRYCSEPRLALRKTVVTRHRIFLEQAHYAASTINLRLAAVRRLAYEASDAGLLSPDPAAGIRRVKGVRKHGVRIGNWLTIRPGATATAGFDRTTDRGSEITP